MSSLGGSTNIKTQINNLWGAIRTLNNTGSDVDLTNYVPKNASSTITGNLTCDSFIKSGGTNIQYLMADGSALTYSSNSGNSNYYLFLNGTDGTTTPADGYITYNQNPFQFQSTMIYISHLTNDGIDIEVFFKQLTTLSEVYIQDKSNAKFMQFNITGTPTITAGQNIAIPVLIRTNSTAGLSQGRQLMISFFTNSIEVDSRLSNLETNLANTQNQSAVLGATTFSGDVISDAFKVNGGTSSQFLKADGSSDNIRIYSVGANLAIGPNSLISNTSGIGNEAIGFGTLKDNTEGNYNNAVGVNALMNNTTGVYNMAFGLSSLYTNITGNYNTGIGARADVSSDNLTNATAIGYNASVTSSNTIQLGDTNITTVNTSGNITANSFVKKGGTSSEFLKADGTVDFKEYLPLVGGKSLTGQVSTNQTPSLPGHLVPKSYVDTFLPKAGGSVSGVIDMGSSGSITSNQTFFAGTNFVTKTYVDNAVSGGGAFLPTAGGTMTGAITMGNNAINTTQSTFTSGQLVSKNYVDTATTFVKCPTGDLGLRILRGSVGGLQTISGNGWTSNYSAGDNRQVINFNPAFSNNTYTVMITSNGAMVHMGPKTTTIVYMYWSNFQNSIIWPAFDFIVIGN